jgi:hypothetical protein
MLSLREQEPALRRIALLLRTTSRSATRPEPLHPVHRHCVGARELPIGGISGTVAVAMRLAVWIRSVGDVRRGGDGPDRAAS